MLEFFETFVFTRQIIELLDDHQYAGLQGALVVDPEAGDLIRGTSGFAKSGGGSHDGAKASVEAFG